MRTESQRKSSTVVIPTDADEHCRRSLVRRRSTLEARLLAHRCGWSALDDIRLRRLERALAEVLDQLGGSDPASELIRQRSC